MLAQFQVVVFDVACTTEMERLRQQHRQRKRYADLMIAAMAVAGQHILVTRTHANFVDVLLPAQLANWIVVSTSSSDHLPEESDRAQEAPCLANEG